MKRIGFLWERVVDWGNLLLAARKARGGKRSRPNVIDFEDNQEYELKGLQRQLRAEIYQPGKYRSFWIFDPKKRQISAAPYRDRVVHHAICNIIEPIFEKRFIRHSYACRGGKGTHQALQAAASYQRSYGFVLKADVKKFFPSIDHEILKSTLAAKFKDERLVRLIDCIIDASNAQEPVCDYFAGDDLFSPHERKRGLPIGNQTSQLFANVLLDPLDHFIKEDLQAPAYVRYCDDFLLFSDSKSQLWEWKGEIANYLDRYRLKLHPRKTVVFPVSEGIPFLGFRVFRTHRLLEKKNIRRFKVRLQQMQEDFADGRITFAEIHQRINSWLGHACHADTFQMTDRILGEFRFRRRTPKTEIFLRARQRASGR